MPGAFEVVILPFLLAAGISLAISLAARPWKTVPAGWSWIAPLAVAGGFVAGFRLINGAFPPWPPPSAQGWMMSIVVLAALLSAAGAVVRLPSGAQVIAVACILAGAFALVLLRRLTDPSNRSEAVQCIMVTAILAMLWWFALRETTHRPSRIAGSIAMPVMSLLCGALLIMSVAIVYGRMAVALAGAAAPISLIALLRREGPGQAVTNVVVTALGSLILAGYAFGSVTWISLILLGVGPLLTAMLRLMLPRIADGWMISILLSALILPSVAAVLIALPEFLRALAELDPSGAG